MNLRENILLALAGLRAGKMRALLTMLGIIIGIGSVIAIVTMGTSLQASFTASMAEMGMNNIEVGLQPKGNSGYYTMSEGDLISLDMINALENYFPDAISATSVSNRIGSGEIRDGRRYANVSVTGTTPGQELAGSMTMVTGRFLAERDIQGSRNVAVISDFAAQKIFGNGDPLGQEIKVHMNSGIQTFTVVGLYEHTMTTFGGMATAQEDISTQVYIPISTSMYIQGRYTSGYSYFNAVAKAGVDAQALAVDITAYLNRFYEKNQSWGVYAFSMETFLEQMNTMLGMISLFIGSVAAISLLVGGIGVMNIMLVSVTERTREIGTRKALGARNSAIRVQFIVEAIIICMIGGLFGILLGVVLGVVGSTFVINAMGGGILTSSVDIPLYVIVVAVGFSMAIGVFFGFYPANKAAKLDPIEALRYE